jgi:hypothetical protein
VVLAEPPAHNHAGLRLAFGQAAEGATAAEVAEALNSADYRPITGDATEATRSVLANRFYVGELPIGKRGAGGWVKGAQGPLVPVELFEAVIVVGGHLAAVRPRPEFRPYFGLAQETRTPILDGSASSAVRASGPEGIRTPDLGLDRAAC